MTMIPSHPDANPLIVPLTVEEFSSERQRLQALQSSRNAQNRELDPFRMAYLRAMSDLAETQQSPKVAVGIIKAANFTLDFLERDDVREAIARQRQESVKERLKAPMLSHQKQN